MADIQSLIQTAANPQEETQQQQQQVNEGADTLNTFNEAFGALAQLLQDDPTLAAKIADLIEQHYSGGEAMQEQTSPAPTPVQAQAQETQVPPELMQRLTALEQTIAQMQRPLADYQLDRELAQLRQSYDKYRKHYGDVLPERFDELEKPVLEKYQAILEGKIPPHELALRTALDEVLHSDDTPLHDRLLAMAAQQAPQPPRVEGSGGMTAAPTNEEQPIPRTTAERMARLKELWKMLNQNPGE